MAKFPIGVKFYPSDKEIMSCLLKTINCQQLPISDILSADDFYGGGKEPWELFGDSDDETERRYFFTKKSGSRNTGKGSWSDKGPITPICGRGKQLIGYKKCFRYESGDDVVQNGKWLLKEYVLPDGDVSDCALCVIVKKKTIPDNPEPLVVSKDSDYEDWDGQNLLVSAH